MLQVIFIHLKVIISLFLFQWRYMNPLVREMRELGEQNNLCLDKKQVKRIKQYMAVGFIALKWGATLRGYPTTKEEKEHMLYFFVMCRFLDDLADEELMTSDEIIAGLNPKDEQIPDHMLLPVFVYEKMKKFSSTEFLEQLERSLIFHDESLKQLGDEKLSEEKLWDITFDKGVSALELARSILRNPVTENELEVGNDLEYFIQLTNDMFDIYKDYQDKQQTVFTATTDMRKNANAYEATLSKLFNAFEVLTYEPKNIKKCMRLFVIIPSFGQVCLTQLLRCQERTDGVFRIEEYSRKELVCDMEKRKNILAYFKYNKMYYKRIRAL